MKNLLLLPLLLLSGLLAGQAGASLNFDGVNDFGIGSNTTLPQGAAPFTIEAWINTPNTHGGIMSWGTGPTTPDRIGLFITNSKVYFTGYGRDLTGNIIVPPNTWTHIAVTYDGVNMRIYVNGVLDNSRTVTLATVGTNFYVGCEYPGRFNLNGNLDELRVWNRGLSQCEVQNNMNFEIPTTATNLIANFHFNQGVAGANNSAVNTITDASGNGNATLTNMSLSGANSNWSALAAVPSGQSVPTSQEITVSGRGINILDGATTVQAMDNTSFRNLSVASSKSNVFSISNTSMTGTLDVNSISLTGVDASMFNVTASSSLPASLASCGILTITVTFNPTSLGVKNATLTINNNDADEAVYDFAVQGNAVVTERALAFNRNNANFVTCGNILPASYTKEAWINISSLAGNMNIISGGDSGGRHILWLYNNTLYAGHNNNYYGPVQDAVALSAGIWYHVAVTYDAATTTMKLYKDGVLVSSNSSVPPFVSGNMVVIGAFDTYNNFNGRIDEVRIWDRARTQAEIVANMDNDLPQQSNLVAYYRFDQGVENGTNTGLNRAFDYSGNGNCGTLSNFLLTGSVSNWTAGYMPNTNTISAPQEIRVTANDMNIVDGDVTPIQVDFTNLGYTNVGSTISRTYKIINGNSPNLVVTGINITGADASQFAVSGVTFPVTVSLCSPLTFTVTFSPTSLGEKNTTLNILSNDADESTFDFAIRGTANTNKGLRFDGINDYVLVPENNALDPGSQLTVEAWVNTEVHQARAQYLSKWDDAGNNRGYMFSLGEHSPGQLSIIFDRTGTYSGALNWATGIFLNANEWYHIAVTHNSTLPSNNVKVYINGVLSAQNTWAFPIYNSASNMILGAYNESAPLNQGANTRWFRGFLDDVRVWNVERSAAQINANMNGELAGNETGLVAYYTFNQNTPGGNNAGQTCLADKTSNSLSGTLVNFGLNGAASNWSTGAPNGPNAMITNPEINLVGNSVSIPDGDITTSAADFTDLGVAASGGSIFRTYTIQNTGSDDLVISGINFTGVDAARFVASGLTFPVTVTPSGNVVFTVTFSSIVDGQRFATMNIVSNDCNETNYDVAIYAIGGCPIITSFPSSTINVNSLSTSCSAAVTYTVTAVATPVATFSYIFGGATTGSGSGTGSGQTFNVGLTNVTVTAASSCGPPVSCTFGVSVADVTAPTVACQPITIGLVAGTATVTGSQIDNNSTDNCGIVAYDCGIIAGVANTNFLNGTGSGGSATVRAINNISPANIYAGLGGTCASAWQPEGTLCDEGSNLNSQTLSTKTNNNSGATWSSGGATGKGVLVVDMATVRSITRLAVFQMFSDGKVTHFRAYSHPSTGATAPTFTDAGWVPLFAEGFVSAGAVSGNTVSLPSNFDFSPTSTRYLKFEVRNDGTHGNAGYIELRNVKAFGTSTTPCNFNASHVGTNVPVRLTTRDATGNQSVCETNISVTNGPREINVRGNAVDIPDGNITTALSNFTDFGITNSGVSVTRVFVIQNQSGEPLTISGMNISGANASDFSIVGPTSFPLTLTANSTQNVNVQFAPNSSGFFNAILNIQSDDADEANYDFAISGTTCISPTFSVCPNNQSINNTTNACNALVNYTATSSATPNPTLTYSFAGATSGSGSGTGTGTLFNCGVTTVTLVSTNNCGAASCTFNVSVNDTQAPTVTCPANMIVTTTVGQPSAVANFTATATDNCGATTITYAPASGSSFNIGLNTVTVTARDAFNNSATCTFTVNVLSPGAALQFMGMASGGNSTTVNDFVVVPDNGTMDLGNVYTIESWVFVTDNTNNTIIDKGDYRYLFQTHPNGNSGLGLYNNSMGWKYSNGAAVPTNTWCHVAVTFDANNNQVRFYLNGNQLGSTLTGIFSSGQDNGVINIGRQSPTTCLCNAFDGTMDELRVWNRVLSQCEIQSYMNCEIPTTATGLVANYHFNQGVNGGNNSGVNTLTDVSGNNNNGTLTNFALTGSTSNWVAPGGVTTGTNCTITAPSEINLVGNSQNIIDGDASPSTADFTDFGTVAINSTLVRTYTIQNLGTGNLSVTSMSLAGAGAANFAIGGISLPAVISPSGSISFNVTFTATSGNQGLNTATLNIASNDCDEATYDVAIQGTVTCLAATTPVISASSNNHCGTLPSTLTITSGTLNNSTDWTWYSTSCGGTLLGTGTSIVVTPTSTTSYFARGEGFCLASGSCGTTTVNVSIIPPAPTVSSSTVAVCPSIPATLNATAPGYNIRWYDSPTGGNLLTTVGSGVNYSVAPTATMVYFAETAPIVSTTTTFAFTGATQSFVVPSGVTQLNISAWGAQGGNSSSAGGNGALASGLLSVTPGQTIFINVGGQNGFNGGGTAFNGAGNGGGASDIRVGGTALSNRVLVAGGGGGSGMLGTSWTGGAGGGGGLNGLRGFASSGGSGGQNGAFGGTQTAGGNTAGSCGCAAAASGTSGQGGNSVACFTWGANGGGGGGGGFFGGGGGGVCGGGAGGGGGSSFVGGGVTGGSVTDNTRTGNGQIVISYTAIATCVSLSRTPVTVTLGSFAPVASSPQTSPSVICTGGASNLSAISTGNNIRWYTTATGGSLLGTVASGADFAVSPTSTTVYFGETFDGFCPAASRIPVTVTVVGDPSITTQPVSPAIVCSGNTSANISIVASNGTPSLNYQWQYNNGGTWAAVADGTPTGSVYTGGTGTTFNVGGITTTGSYRYRCVVSASGVGCDAATSNVVTVTVEAYPNAPTVSSGSLVSCPNSAVNLNASAPGYSIRWYDAPTGGNVLATVGSSTNYVVTPSANTVYYAETFPLTGATATFNHTGSVQTFTVPAGVTSINIDAYGAQGGDAVGNITGWSPGPVNVAGGLGGRVQTTLAVTPGQVLSIFVGSKGTTSGAGGYNGGGSTGGCSGTDIISAGGGGATDIRTGAGALSDRVIVAGGGGGTSSSSSTSYRGVGGAGGGTTAANGLTTSGSCLVGNGGSQFAGGAGGNQSCWCGTGAVATNGTLGFGANSICTPSGISTCSCAGTGCVSGAGGGGGYFGGGASLSFGGGGGGSSFAGAGTSSVAHTQGVRTGNGLVVITYLGLAGCSSTTRTAVTVTLNTPPPVPTSALASPAAICTGGVTNLSAISTSNNIRWYATATGGSPLGTVASGANFVVSPTTTTVYFAETFDGSCPAASRVPVTVTVVGDPSITTQPVSPAIVCSGNTSANISIAASNGTPSLGYQWQYNNGGTWAAVADGTPTGSVYTGGTGTTFNVGGITTAGSYQFRCVVSAAGSGCDAVTSNPVTVTIEANPSAPTVASNNLTVCPNNSVNLTATAPGYSIRWYNVPTGGTILGTVVSGASLSVAPTVTTVYYAETFPITSVTTTFSFTGATQSFVVPAGVTQLNISAWGAQGGNSSSAGGNGALASGLLSVTPGQTLFINVGGQNGFNGGGVAFNLAGNGGGASDIRVGGTALSNRVLVAGGGGGSGRVGTSWTGGAGGGGGLNGLRGFASSGSGGGQSGAFGGTQSGGGATAGDCGSGCGIAGTGTSGQGGNSVACSTWGSNGGGGGGGGFFGGGGGGICGGGAGGGGGSSFIGGVTGGSVTDNTRTGNGQIVITYIGTSCPSATRTPVTVTFSPQVLSISCPADVTVSNASGLCTASVTIPTPTTSASCPTLANALDLDGNSDFVSIPHSASLNLTNATYETWVNWDGSSNIGNIFMKGDYGWGVGIRSDGVIEWWQQFLQNSGPNSIGSVPVGVWTHIAVAVTNGGNVSFYINGVLSGTVSGALIVNNSDPLYIGRQGHSCNCNFYDGEIDEFRIWNVIRSQAEIQANMNASLGSHPNLVSQYKFDQGTPAGNNSAISQIINSASGGSVGTLNSFSMNGSVSNFVMGYVSNALQATNSFNGTSNASGNFPVGTTSILWTVSDGAGNSATCTQTVRVNDTQAPTLACPADMVVTAINSLATPSVSYIATATDNCSVGTTVSYNPASGSNFAVGLTTVTVTAQDASNNMTTCTFTVNVSVADTEAPIVNCPSVVAACGSQTVTFAATATDNSGALTVTYSPASGSVFGIGTTPVLVTAVDAAGNVTTCTFNVRINHSSFNAALAQTSDNAQVLNDVCEETGWTYYADPDNSNYYFAVNWAPDGTLTPENAQAKANAEVQIFLNNSIYGATTSSANGGPARGTWVMKRGWNVRNASTLTEPVGVRFFYDAAELSTIQNAATNFAQANTASGSAVEPLTWFKTTGGQQFDPADMNSTVTLNSNGVYVGNSIALNVVNTGIINGIAYVEFDGVTSFSGGGAASGVGGGNPLPVELMYFTGQQEGDKDRLEWATASESNVSHYELEHSRNGSDFIKINQTAAAGNSQALQEYFAYNETPVLGNNYYRLRTVGTDGTSSISNVINLFRNSDKPAIISVYPNPTDAGINYDILTVEAVKILVKVTDITGRLVYEKEIDLQAGVNTLQYDCATCTSGAYLLQLFNENGEVSTHKFIRN